MIRAARPRRILRIAAPVLVLFTGATLAGHATAAAQAATKAVVPVEEFRLDNGMRFLLVRQPEKNTVAAGWVAHVGSANERPGITGLSHLFEHMLFKGSHTIGTTAIERDLAIIDEQEKVQEQLRRVYREQRERWRRGEIDDPFDPKHRTAEQIELEGKFQELVAEQRKLMVKDEFDKIYSEAGATSMNASTNTDITFYQIVVPANRLELWFWMESDRLLQPVLREFYSERDVVHEERRLRIESTPTGKYDEQFEAMFWQSHPYHWPVVGWPSDLRVISKQQADEYYATYYAPNNLTAALVGNFDPAEVRTLAQRYFGRLRRGEREPPDVVTLEMPQLAEKRMRAECDCQPQVEIRYHTTPFRNADSPALDVLAGLLNGRTGRLYKGLVLNREIASSASSGQRSRKWGGWFSFTGETRGDASPEQLEAAWYEELRRIQDEPIPADELQKVKNQISATAFRRLNNPFLLMVQLLVYDGQGDWTYLNTWSDTTLAVTEADVKRVARTYFTPENRAVALYARRSGAGAEEWPAEMGALSPEQQQRVKAQIRQLGQVQDKARLGTILEQLRQRKGDAPPDARAAMTVVERWLESRIEALGKAAAGGAS
jgi:predicted Zn-dependent peptidase